MQYASIGSISSGTLRNEDLLDSLAYELEYQLQRSADLSLEQRNGFSKLVWDAREMLDVPENDRSDIWEMAASEFVNELMDELTFFAPPYCYFGSHPGDGADFGFWPDVDAINELPHIKDPSELPTGEDCVFVNDHGNMTVYDATGKVIFECV